MLSIHFINDGSGDQIVGNYRWKVMINNTCLAEGIIKNHNRLSGWRGLVKYFTEMLDKPKNKKGKVFNLSKKEVFNITESDNFLDHFIKMYEENFKKDKNGKAL